MILLRQEMKGLTQLVVKWNFLTEFQSCLRRLQEFGSLEHLDLSWNPFFDVVCHEKIQYLVLHYLQSLKSYNGLQITLFITFVIFILYLYYYKKRWCLFVFLSSIHFKIGKQTSIFNVYLSILYCIILSCHINYLEIQFPTALENDCNIFLYTKQLTLCQTKQ